MYEAVPSTSASKQAGTSSEMDAEIDKFLPLLKDYLNGAYGERSRTIPF